jgi:hypothetical protein
VPVFSLSIFGREKSASLCINCGEAKFNLVNVGEELYNRYPRLWSLVNSILLKEVLVNTKTPTKADDLSDKVDVGEFIKL